MHQGQLNNLLRKQLDLKNDKARLEKQVQRLEHRLVNGVSASGVLCMTHAAAVWRS